MYPRITLQYLRIKVKLRTLPTIVDLHTTTLNLNPLELTWGPVCLELLSNSDHGMSRHAVSVLAVKVGCWHEDVATEIQQTLRHQEQKALMTLRF